jgi:hypothetical protein
MNILNVYHNFIIIIDNKKGNKGRIFLGLQ